VKSGEEIDFTAENSIHLPHNMLEKYDHTSSSTNFSLFVYEVNFTVPKIPLPIGFEGQPLHLQHIDLEQFNKYSLHLEEVN
jgi:hypothetical protein